MRADQHSLFSGAHGYPRAAGSAFAESPKVLDSSAEQPESVSLGPEGSVGVADHETVPPVETPARKDEHGESTGSNSAEDHAEGSTPEQNSMGKTEGGRATG